MKKKIMHKPRVIFIGPVPPPYMGPSLATEIILNSKLGEAFDLVHLDTSHHSDLSTLGKVGFANISAALKHYFLLLKMLAFNRVDIVYIPISQKTVGYLRDSVFILIAKMFKKKVVCHLRGGNFRRWYESVSPRMKSYVNSVHKTVDVQIVLGEKLKELFFGIVPENRIYVVPNGRDFEWVDKIQGDGGRKHTTRILFLSNFVKTKGVLDVLRAIPMVVERCNDVEFIFAGAWFDADIKEEMLELVKKYPQYPINMAGRVVGQEKLNLLRGADIFVFPTYYPPEGHPWAIVEAMAAGLPVISTDQGAITESVVDGVNGYIVEKQAPTDIADKIIKLCVDRDLSRAMGEESRKLYKKEFSEERMVERMTIAFNAAFSR